MPKLLFTTLPTDDLGLLIRSLPIAKELASRGAEVIFSSPARAPSVLIASAGFRNIAPQHPIYDLLAEGDPIPAFFRCLASEEIRRRYGSPLHFLARLIPALPLKNAPSTAEVWNMGQAGAQMGMLHEGFVRSNLDAYIELIRQSGADAVVDFWNPFAVIASRYLRKPLITVLQADAHPAGRGFIWWKPPPDNIPTPVPTLNKVMARYGLPPISKFEELSTGDLTLVVGTPETDPLPKEADPIYTGPILWQHAKEILPDWILKRDSAKPLVWIYSGNPRYFSANAAFDSIVVIQASIAALADENLQVILTTGHHALPEEFLPLPGNFRHVPFLPGLAMAEQSDLMIHHGGYGSCQTGMYTGTPAVILPTYSERESNARRVAGLGAGEFVTVRNASGKKSVRTEELQAAVRRVLGDPSYAENARRILWRSFSPGRGLEGSKRDKGETINGRVSPIRKISSSFTEGILQMKNTSVHQCAKQIIFFVALGCMVSGCAYSPAETPVPAAPTETARPSPASPTAEQGEYWPTDGWRTSAPEAQGMDGGLLDQIAGSIKAQKLNLDSLLVIRNGYIVHETYFGSQSANQRHIQYSVTKSFISTLIGIALDRGSIDRVDRRVLDFFPGITITDPDPRMEGMTIEDLLTMRSGLAWSDTDQDFNNLFRSTNWVQHMLNLPMVAEPGTKFSYCSGCTNLLSAVQQEATGMTARDFGEEALFQPLGISDIRWETDPTGISIGGWGLFLTPRDMAKLGYLFLNRGMWDGEQIVSAGWVDDATRKQTPTDGTLGYGYQWWTYPSWDAYAALGRDGQTIFVMPGSNVIVVTTAGGVGHDKIFQLIEDYIYPAIQA